MKPVKFDEQNTELGNGLPGYYSVPCYVTDNGQVSVIMKIKVTPEEWEKVKENNFEFWYTRETGDSGLQPFSFATESPFIKLYAITDLSPSGLKEILQDGSRIGNFHVGRDVPIYEIVSLGEEMIVFNKLDAFGRVEFSSMETMINVSHILNRSPYSDKWFISNPKNV